eukprot:540284-Rhodomonas_salina.1
MWSAPGHGSPLSEVKLQTPKRTNRLYDPDTVTSYVARSSFMLSSECVTSARDSNMTHTPMLLHLPRPPQIICQTASIGTAELTRPVKLVAACAIPVWCAHIAVGPVPVSCAAAPATLGEWVADAILEAGDPSSASRGNSRELCQTIALQVHDKVANGAVWQGWIVELVAHPQ